MSEKRFRVCCDDDLGDMWVVDIVTDEEYWTAPSLVDVLNKQSDRIMLLEDNLLAMNMTNGNLEGALKYLEEENDKLKQQNRVLYKCALYGKTVGDEL